MDYAGLKPFCATDLSRVILREPWSQDRFSYASNGHIIVKVARLPEVAEREDQPDVTAAFAAAADQDTAALPAIKFPQPVFEACPDCCQHCREDCWTCDGARTRRAPVSASLRGAIFDARYIELIAQLPGAEFSTTPPPAAAARFIFADGEGVLMPMKRPYDHHFDAEPPPREDDPPGSRLERARGECPMRETHAEGTDGLRLAEWAYNGPRDRERAVPTLRQYSEIELWALAGIFLDRDEDFARFIAHYAACVLEQTQYRGEGLVGYERPTADHPNPDPLRIWQDWISGEPRPSIRQHLAPRAFDGDGFLDDPHPERLNWRRPQVPPASAGIPRWDRESSPDDAL